MNLADISKIYEYNFWATKRLLAAGSRLAPEQFTAPATFPYGGLRGTLVHILDAEFSWRMLILQGRWPGDMDERDYPTMNSVEVRWIEEELAMRAYLTGLNDADIMGIVRYITPEGVERQRVLWHCLYHVVNHGTQHRSEAAAILTNLGQSPGDMDFTLFLNETK